MLAAIFDAFSLKSCFLTFNMGKHQRTFLSSAAIFNNCFNKSYDLEFYMVPHVSKDVSASATSL